MSLEPCSHIAGAAFDRPFGFEALEAFLVEILFAAGLAARERDDFGDWLVAIVHHHCAARADVIEIAREPVAQFRDFGFFHDSWIVANVALSGYEGVRRCAPRVSSRSNCEEF